MSENDAQHTPDDASVLDSDPAESSEEPADGLSADDLQFEDDALGEKLRHVPEEELNAVSFGIIRIDDDGVVQFFNDYESKLSGVPPEEAIDRNFFTQVAPCTNNRLFWGRFKRGVRRGDLDEVFSYTYTYKMRPTLVDVHLYRDEAGNNWILVQKY